MAFASMFSCPSGSSGPKEGVTDESAITIPGITVKEFETLFKFFYEGCVSFLTL